MCSVQEHYHNITVLLPKLVICFCIEGEKCHKQALLVSVNRMHQLTPEYERRKWSQLAIERTGVAKVGYPNRVYYRKAVRLFEIL
jgi:hypothetical protein